MQITRVQLRLTNEDVVRAYVDITLDHCLVIHGLALIRHSTDYLVAMPRNKRRGGKPYEIALPITQDMRRMIEDAIMEEYKKVASEAGSPSTETVALNGRSPGETRR